MSDLELLVRHEWDIPDDKDVKEYCEENGMDYRTEMFGAYCMWRGLVEKKKNEMKKSLEALFA